MERAILRVPPPPTIDDRPVMVSQDNATAITGRSRRTVQRWIRYGRITDPAALRLLQTACYGLILGDGWHGWRIEHGRLLGPDGDAYTVADLRAEWINRRLVIELQRRCDQLEREKAARDAQAQGPLFRILA